MATKPKKSTNHFVRVEPDQAIDLSSVLQGIRSQPGQAPADPVEEPGMFRSLADSGLALGSGVVTGAKMVTDAFGADNSASQFLGDTVQGMQSLYSPHRQAELARRAQIIKAAEEGGSTMEELSAYLGGLVEAPVDTLLNAAGTMVPTAASMLIPGAREANVARLLGAGMGAVQGAGAGKSSIYDATLERELAEGRSPDEAKALAAEAQSYGGENTDLIAANAGLGVLAGSSGVERALHALKFGRQGAASAPGLLRRTGTGALAEGVPEGFQGGVEQLSGNVALQRQGYEDVPTMRGVLGSGAMEAVAGGGLGAVTAIPRPADPAAPPIVPPGGPLSRAANAGAAVAPPAPEPVALAPEQEQALLAHANQRAREIEEKANGTKEQKVTGLDGKPVTIPGKQPEFLTPAEKEEREFLQANGGDAQALAKAYQIPAAPTAPAAPAASTELPADPETGEIAPPAVDAAPAPQPAPANTFASLDEADAYVDGQMKRNGAAAGAPVENEDGTIALVPKSDPRYASAQLERQARKKARRTAAKITEPSNDLAGEAAQPGPADAGAVPGTERMGGQPADLGAVPGPDAPIAAGDVRNGGDAAGAGRGQRNDALSPPDQTAILPVDPPATVAGFKVGEQVETPDGVGVVEAFPSGRVRVNVNGKSKPYPRNAITKPEQEAGDAGVGASPQEAPASEAGAPAGVDAAGPAGPGPVQGAGPAAVEAAGVDAQAAPVAEDAPEAAWTRATEADRYGILARAGWAATGDKPSTSAQRAARMPWAKLSESQRARIGGALSAAAPAAQVAPEGAGAKTEQVPAVTGGDADRAEQQPVDADGARLQVAARGQRQRSKGRDLDPANDTLLQAISKLGGIGRDKLARFGLRPEELAHQVRIGNLKGHPFRKSGGSDPDSMLERLVEAGYLYGANPDDRMAALEEAIKDEIGGLREHRTAEGEALKAQQRDAEDRADYQAEISEEEAAERAAIMAEAEVSESGMSALDDNDIPGFDDAIQSDPKALAEFLGEPYDEAHDGAKQEATNTGAGEVAQGDSAQDRQPATGEAPPADGVGSQEARALSAAEGLTGPATPEPAKPATITDVGEKIGGARKDTAERGFTRGSKAEKDERPAWARRFEISQIVTPGGMLGEVKDAGRWVIRDNKSLDWTKQPKQVGRQTFATREEAEAFVPIAAVGLKHRPVPTREGKFEIWRDITDRKRVKVVDQVFDTRDEAMAYMLANAVAIVETNTTFGEADIPTPPDRQRTGLLQRSALFDAVINAADADAKRLADRVVTQAGLAKPDSLSDIPPQATTDSAGLTGDVRAALNESLAYVAATNANLLRYLNDAGAFTEAGYGSLDIPSRRLVKAAMLSLGQNKQVLGAVVQLVPVDVMDLLASKELSPKGLFGDEAMLGDLLSVDVNPPIRTPDARTLALMRAVARAGTKGRLLQTIRSALESDAALSANGLDFAQEAGRQKNVSGPDFKDQFGFRSIEFGNWNNQDERQALMNDAWDGLMDLADVLGLPPKALGMNGQLALAFGARGHGLQGARAHYELEKLVINLTKEKGAGSLAHEWFHALDHYFGRQDGKASAEWVVGKDGTRSIKVSDEGQAFVSHGFGYKSQVREELRTAYKTLMETMFKKAETFVQDTQQADKFVGAAKQDLERELQKLRASLAEQKDPQYWKRNNKPASAEQLAEFDAIAKQMLDAELSALDTDWKSLPNGKDKVAHRWTNDSLERLNAIFKEVRGRSGFNAEKKGVLDYLRANMARYSQRLKMLAEAQAGAEKSRAVPTEFAMNAKELDQGRGGDYWTTPHEMAARAFQAYVEDKIAERGGSSRFLTYGPENAGILTPWGWKRPFPAGQERVAINTAFDAFLGQIKTREDDAGNVAMFSRRSSGSGVTRRDAEAAVDLLRRELPSAPEIVLLDRVQDAPAELQATIRARGAENDVEAVYEGGVIYAFPGNFIDMDRFMFVVGRHEVRHAGFDAMLGQDKDAILMSIGRANRRVALEARKLMDDGFAASFAEGVEEALADMTAEDVAALSRIKLAVAAIRRWLRATAFKLRKAGWRALADAIEPRTWSDNDVIAFVKRAEDVSRGPGGGGGARFSRADDAGSPAFKKWFGDSKVVDAEGKPLVVYHGTTADFTAFDPAKRGSKTGVSDAREGFFFAANGKAASEFTWESGDMTGSVMPVFLSMQNPLRVKIPGEWAPRKYDAAIADAKAGGHDGLIIEGVATLGTPGDYFIAFRPEQIKSAIGNRGTFDPANPDIRFSRAKIVTNDEGLPEFEYGGTKLAFPIPSDRMEVIPVAGQQVLHYAIMPSDSFDVLGHVELLLENGRPVSLLDIEAYSKGGGVGRQTVETLLRALGGQSLNISNIVPAAQTFWERMGVPTQNLEEGAAYDGNIDLETFLQAQDGQGARAGSRSAGGQGRSADAGAEAGAPGPTQGRKAGRLSRASRQPLETVRDAAFRSGEAVKELNLLAGYKVGDFLESAGKLSWWDKSVGTPYNLAKRSPTFARVYDAAQAFLSDVSYHAKESANLAPGLLPELDTIADLKKKPISAADNKALAAPIFEGTLSWVRDADGKPVRVADAEAAAAQLSLDQKAHKLLQSGKLAPGLLKGWQGSMEADAYEKAVNTRYANAFLTPGVVWTESELRQQFGLKDEQIGLYKEFRAATDKSLDDLTRSELARLARVDLGTVAPEPGQSVDDFAVALRDRLYEAGADDTADRVIQVADRLKSLKERGYAPLSRFGHYTLDVVQDGERVWFGLYESQAEANKAARKMAETFPGATVTQGTQSQEAYKLFAGISPETIELFGDILGLDADGDSASDKAFQEYLKRATASRSAMKRMIHRKGIAGFSEDVGRVLAGFITSNARRASAQDHMGEIGEAAEAIPKEQGELKDYALKFAEYVKNPTEEAQAIRGVMFTQYLGGSISSALVNMTQPFTVAFPYLSQFGGVAKAGAALTKAMADMRPGGKLEADLAAALHRAEEDGKVAPQEIHQLMAQARSVGALRSGDGTKAGDAAATVQNHYARLQLVWGKLFSFAELTNRRMTYIAAYRMAKANGEADPDAFARKAIDETMFVMNKGNRPQWARGAIGATLFTFKSYMVSYLELMARMYRQGGPEGKKAFWLGLAVLLVMGGGDELPFMENIEDLVDGFAQNVLGQNWQSKAKRHEFMADLLGKDLAEFLNRGVSSIGPVDVTGRFGMGSPIPGTGLFRRDTQDTGRDWAQILGPVGDLVPRMFRAGGMALRGDVGQAALEASPVAARNAAKGMDMWESGMYKDTKGRKVIETDAGDALWKGIGFQPAEVGQVQSASVTSQRIIALNKSVEAEIADLWAKGRFEKDPAKVDEARKKLREWNAQNPDSPIKLQMGQIQKRVSKMSETKAERLAKTAPKELRESVRRDLNEANQ